MIDAVTLSDNGTLNLTGNCTYTGGTFIRQCTLIIGDGTTNGWIVGDVVFTNSVGGYEYPTRILEFNRSDDVTFPGNIGGPGGTLAGGLASVAGEVEQSGSGRLTLTGNNTYLGGTVVNGGVLQVGNGGTNGTIGPGAIDTETEIDFDHSDLVAISPTNTISGGGSLVQLGSGTLKLLCTNQYTGATTISNGTMVVTNVAGEMDVFGGILSPGGDPTIDTLTVAGNLNMSGGTILVYVNTALSPSNTIIQVSGSINITNGTLKFVNLGPGIAQGDVFNIFNGSQVATLGHLTIVAPGFTLSTNNMAASGSVSVSSVAAAGSEIITASVSGGQIHLSWPAIWTGVHLQKQVDALSAGIGAASWVTIAGSDASNTYSEALSSTGAVFYRLAP